MRITAEHHRTRADRRLALDHRPQQRPVLLRLERSRRRRGARGLVVDEHHSVADEDLVLDRDAVADERVALDLAASADDRAALDLDERADPGLVSDRAAVEIRERDGRRRRRRTPRRGSAETARRWPGRQPPANHDCTDSMTARTCDSVIAGKIGSDRHSRANGLRDGKCALAVPERRVGARSDAAAPG